MQAKPERNESSREIIFLDSYVKMTRVASHIMQ